MPATPRNSETGPRPASPVAPGAPALPPAESSRAGISATPPARRQTLRTPLPAPPGHRTRPGPQPPRLPVRRRSARAVALHFPGGRLLYHPCPPFQSGKCRSGASSWDCSHRRDRPDSAERESGCREARRSRSRAPRLSPRSAGPRAPPPVSARARATAAPRPPPTGNEARPQPGHPSGTAARSARSGSATECSEAPREVCELAGAREHERHRGGLPAHGPVRAAAGAHGAVGLVPEPT